MFAPLLILQSLLAQPLLEERFDMPLGAQWLNDLNPGTFSLTSDAAHWGARGARFDKDDAGAGTGNVTLGSLDYDFTPGLRGEIHFRLWFNVQDGGTTVRTSPLQVGQPIDAFTLGELYVDETGGGTVMLSCADRVFRRAAIAQVLTPGQWHLLELDLEGLGTDAGSCSGAVDGHETSLSGLDWGARSAVAVLVGFNVVADRWRGTWAADDFTVTRTRFAMATGLDAPRTVGSQGCAPLGVSFLGRDGGTQTPPTTATFLLSVDGGTGFADLGCSTPLPSRPITAAETQHLSVLVAAPTADVTLASNDLLTSRTQIHLQLEDAGASEDAGAGARHLQVGCGCGALNGLPCAALLAVLARRRRAHAQRCGRFAASA